ncbi:Protein fluG [Cercospora beticola]|uniref:Protein fluG n=1 Tax=Cercospora beticola TaxID=122368 RepID=A0A2G5HZ71_CERBT|nr:Protein fluG [Cercospora beticola]PIA97791.1 Protein fluG [Cercospora beticola]WPA98302.1 hypothetical protein RHO25_002914 [Cercospora beticola]
MNVFALTMAVQHASIEELRRMIRTHPVIDNHAHNLLRLEQLKQEDFLSATSEATGTQIILIDDGLIGDFHPYDWHDQFVASPCKRIVRIEAIASEILHGLHKAEKLPVGIAIADEEACSLAWIAFITAFEEAIVAYLEDDAVVGFKSVICYRTGLDIEFGSDLEVSETALRSFMRHYLPRCVENKFRVETKGMNDALVISTCKLLQASSRQNGVAKPLQFHTGFGDNDISLLDSNPAVMQDFIKVYPEVPIVLLHSSYPYTRDAGYLATVYKNVFLDLGEVFPQVSRDGQEQIIRQALEITPTSKLLWSTDAHHFPETYYLGNVQGRAALEKVFCEYVEQGDLSVHEAVGAAKRILFENSNSLYQLGLTLPNEANSKPLDVQTDQGAANTTTTAQQMSTLSAQSLLQTILPVVHDHNVQYVFVQWLDYMAQLRSRWLPIKSFNKLLNGDGRFSISRGNLGTTPNDHMSSARDPVGSIYVEPDLTSFRLMQDVGPIKNAATVMASFTDETGEPLVLCPRARLTRLVQELKDNYSVELLIGFEIEITFCRREVTQGDEVSFSPLDTNHAWGTFSDEQYAKSLELITSIVGALANIGVEIEQFHSEAGAGQYEFILPPLPPIEAVDTLIQAKQCIQQTAALHGHRATCHSNAFPGIGTAAHAHISLNSNTLSSAELKASSESFAAAILQHLPAICALTMPQSVSYNRVADDSWTGGTWVAWGTNNRETPLRRVNDTRWEVRCLDGFANMYLALSALLSAGLYGMESESRLELQDCKVNPTKLSEDEKKNLGIIQRLPRSLEEALAAMEADEEFQGLLGREVAMNWLAVEKATMEMLAEMPEAQRRIWLMERY